MAAPGWKTNLPQNSLFRDLYTTQSSISHTNSLKNIISVHDNIVYVWDNANSCVQSTNLLSLKESELVNGEDSSESSKKTLLLTDTPLFPVRELLLSQSGCHLALVGDRGITVVVLPQLWTRRRGCGGKNSVLCRSISIGDWRLSRSSVRVLDVAWHPGCQTETLLVVLTSDGKLCFYDIHEALEPVEEVVLCDETGNGNLSGTIDCPSVYEMALGEIPVSFDFGQAMVVDKKKNGEVEYPIFVLWGNGNVQMVVTGITSQQLTSPVVLGPLLMQPPAEDNYGVDACSLICLATSPQVLSIATCSGTLYHCILLDNDKTQNNNKYDCGSKVTLCEPVMYVYESVELELSLTTVDVHDDSRLEDDFTCHIKLHTDRASPVRYHCTHSAGLHTVLLPWIKRLETFIHDIKSPQTLDPSQQALVEHLICTKPLPASLPAPVQGFCVVTETGLETSLICLTCDYECIVLPLRSRCRTEPAPLISHTSSRRVTSPLRAARKEPFKRHISQILARSSSNPLLKASKQYLTSEECYQLLTRATQVFREEYIYKQILAKTEIDKKVDVLTVQKKLQIEDLVYCGDLQVALKENAEHLAEKFDQLEQKQKEIYERVECVLHKIQSRLPVISDAEKTMSKELQQMYEYLDKMENALEQIKSKKKLQPRFDVMNRSRINSPVPSVTTPQVNKIKTLIKDEGDVITDNMRRLKLVKAQLGV